jgi:hypothetical protein
VCAVVIDHGQFQIAVERRSRYGLPLHYWIIGSAESSVLI